jgi:hypothetical protein
METLVHGKPDLMTRPLRHLRSPVSDPSSHPIVECPTCHSGGMRRVANESIENYLCKECGRCWSLSSTGVTRVNPLSCTGCDRHEFCVEEFRKALAACCWLPTGK